VEEIGSSSEEEETNEENLKKQQALYEKEKVSCYTYTVHVIQCRILPWSCIYM